MLKRLLLSGCALVAPAFCGFLSQSVGVEFGPGPDSSGASSICSSSTPAPAILNQTCVASGATSATVKASAAYDGLKTYASFTSLGETNGYINAHATASFTDTITLDSTGGADHVTLWFTLTGGGNSGGGTANFNISGPGGFVAAHDLGTYRAVLSPPTTWARTASRRPSAGCRRPSRIT